MWVKDIVGLAGNLLHEFNCQRAIYTPNCVVLRPTVLQLQHATAQRDMKCLTMKMKVVEY